MDLTHKREGALRKLLIAFSPFAPSHIGYGLLSWHFHLAGAFWLHHQSRLIVLQLNQAWPDICIPRHTELPPYHFNYTESPTLGTSYTTDRYLILHALDKVLYEKVYPELREFRFVPSDFEKLERDPSVAKLYSNGGLDVYFIYARASPT